MMICVIKDCNRKHYAKELCRKHYATFKRTGNPLGLKKECLAPGCDKMVIKDYCRKHFYRGRNNLPFGITLPRGNYKGGISQYYRHNVLKKNRLIKLKQQPFCEVCGKKADRVHHKDLTKYNHDLDNLMSICNKCNCQSKFCKPRTSKYKKLFGATLKELGTCFNVSQTTILNRIKNGQPLDRPRWQHYLGAA